MVGDIIGVLIGVGLVLLVAAVLDLNQRLKRAEEVLVGIAQALERQDAAQKKEAKALENHAEIIGLLLRDRKRGGSSGKV